MIRKELKDFIDDAKKYMTDTSNRVNIDKTVEFKDIDLFLEQNLDEKEMTTVMEKIALLKKQLSLFVGDVLNQFGKSVVSKKNEDGLYHLGIMYLIMIKSDKDLALNIDDKLLYVITNSMRNIPCKRYNEAMKRIFYPDLIRAIMSEGYSIKSATILNKLAEKVTYSNDIFDEKALAEYMNTFMFFEVYPRIGISDNIIGDERVNLELLVNKYSLQKFIKDTEGMKNPDLLQIRNKLDAISAYESMDIPTATRYLSLGKLISQNEDNKFILNILQLTILGMSQFIDITNLEEKDLLIIMNRISKLPYNKFSEILSKESHK